ncbi:hypothetical protein ASNO1_24660 [Corallococcus caeni]|uniref:Sulfatase N-terminal domain-containing protein n=1 Tax=Corallococcus caeni TaxID=3082388 RepID=A0ABQ6QQC4_9BACT|nr:hypothetical protein ASNO1_24660 [Corallococcus sp. NO1]
MARHKKKEAGEQRTPTADVQPDRPSILMPPQGAPNVVIVLLDDVGFGASSAFGGPIPMPTLEALARQGLRVQPIPYHGDVLAQPCRFADGPQSPQRPHGGAHGDRHGPAWL